MRILLVGNYALDNQHSMQGYAAMLSSQLSGRGHQTEIIRPRAIMGNLLSRGVLRKWLGYIDKYILFPPKLRARSREFDVVHVCDHSNSMYLSHTAGRPSSITCHDLLQIGAAQGRYPKQTRVSRTGKTQQRWILAHLAAARHVVCVSTHTAHEFATFTSKPVDDMVIIPHSLNFPFAPASEQNVLNVREKFGIAHGEQYLMHVGGDLWYKNRIGVLRIFESLRDMLLLAGTPAPRLVMAGYTLTQEMRSYIADRMLTDSVIEAFNPTNEELRSLYTGAAALLFPSLYEGFGWPLIEAQSCGCPVITSDRPPMTEVAGDAALYIDPADEPGAGARIADGFDRLPLLREAGFRNVQRFNPDRIGEEYERFFAAVVGGTTSQAGSGVVQPEPSIETIGKP